MKPILVRGIWNLRCRYNGKDMRCSAKTRNKKTAFEEQEKVNKRLIQLTEGLFELPPGVSPRDFLLLGIKTGVSKTLASAKMEDLVVLMENEVKRSGTAPSSKKADLTHLKHIRRFLGTVEAKKKRVPSLVKDWEREHVYLYREWRMSEAGAVKGYPVPRACTVKREICLLKAMFYIALEKKWIMMNPVAGLKHLFDKSGSMVFRTNDEALEKSKQDGLSSKETKAILRYRVYSLPEIKELLGLLRSKADVAYVLQKGDVAMVMEIVAETGVRIGEALKLKRSDLHLDAKAGVGDITILSKKQSRSEYETPRYAPIPPETVKRLAAWLDTHNSPYVFGSTAPTKPFVDKLYRQLDKATKNTKFVGLRPHQLRHSFRTNMWDKGVNEAIIDEIVGHTTKAMAKRYRHIRNDHIRKAISKVWGSSDRNPPQEDGDGGREPST